MFCLPGLNTAGVCLLKGPIDRPEAWAFPAERLLTALTVLLGVACQQLPLSINQYPKDQQHKEMAWGQCEVEVGPMSFHRNTHVS